MLYFEGKGGLTVFYIEFPSRDWNIPEVLEIEPPDRVYGEEGPQQHIIL